ncbi:phosphonate C-P lyase system protein PhnH [Paludibacterium sp. B53371]|uniref:phosphonate C-P lyase system protein PhnH n=1 Tax=Paludibacterium sp. B53371 TaxID=2806263 RepID=UPI001C04C9AC|nr:phosphonate C-P lyase system protein PhnH [Paludibacterium sp. B53371]
MLHTAFEQPVDQCQQVFRAVLSALAEPLLPRRLPCLPPPLPGLSEASAALLYSLVDQEVAVWLPPLPADTLESLRFHTGLQICRDVAQADFILLTRGCPLPALTGLKSGTAEYPDRSATLLIEVEQFNTRQIEGCGPGIPACRRFGAVGLAADFWTQWQQNHTRFPRGVDVILLAGEHIAGLPRSTRIQEG